MEKIALVIEDTDANRDFFERLLAQAGFKVLGTASGREALELMDDVEQLALAVIDMQIPDMSGLQILTQLRQRYPDACLIIATMHDEHSLMESAFQRDCDVFLVKPHGFMELFKRITGDGVEAMRQSDPLIIDHYGPRHYRPG